MLMIALTAIVIFYILVAILIVAMCMVASRADNMAEEEMVRLNAPRSTGSDADIAPLRKEFPAAHATPATIS